MAPADLQQVIQLLKNQLHQPGGVERDGAQSRHALRCARAPGGRGDFAPAKGADISETSDPFYGEIFEGHIGYLRFGALTPANLRALDAALQKYAGKKIDAVVIDLRASAATNDFATAAEFANRFCAKGKPLFTLRRSRGKTGARLSFPIAILLTPVSDAGLARWRHGRPGRSASPAIFASIAKALLIGQPRPAARSSIPICR